MTLGLLTYANGSPTLAGDSFKNSANLQGLSEPIFGAADPKAGACGSLYQLCQDPRLNHELPVTAGVLADEAGLLLTRFFAARR